MRTPLLFSAIFTVNIAVRDEPTHPRKMKPTLHLFICQYAVLALGLCGITARGDDAAVHLRATVGEGKARLEWTLSLGEDVSSLLLFRTDSPKGASGQPLVTLAAGARDYIDPVPNWTPRYYRIVAVDAAGKTAATSNLAVAVARSQISAAPVETFAFWYEAYKPSASPEASVKRMGNAAFVLGPGAEAAADLKNQGTGLLPYVTYYQTASWAGTFPKGADVKLVAAKIAALGFFRKTARFVDAPEGYVPSVFSRPASIEYDPAAVQYTTCPNSRAFRDMVLASARQQLEGGAMGFFVDNGYQDDVAAVAVCESQAHEHYYGDDLASADAFVGLLLDVFCETKRRNPAGVLMVNGGVPAASRFYGLALGDVCDGQLWESYLRSSYATPAEHVTAWEPLYRQSVEREKSAYAVPPHKTFVLSYPWDREEAFLCYATAKLCDLPWSANLGDSDPHHTKFGGHFGTYPELINLRLGRPTYGKEFGGHKQGELYVREYEHGLVIVNPTKAAQKGTVALGKPRKYRSMFSAEGGEGSSMAADLPAESGRVYVWH